MKRRLSNIFTNLHWQTALGEIILIFIGITTAIWFNNWNEAQKAKDVELKTLREIRDAIREDMRDVEINMEGYKTRIEAFSAIENHLRKQAPLTDSFLYNLPYLQSRTSFLSVIGPYETLKSRGLAIITNDSIRLKISHYYDLEYDKILTNEQEHHDHFAHYIKPSLINDFDIVDYRPIPNDYERLRQEGHFLQIIAWALRNNEFMLYMYEAFYKEGTALAAKIEKEINRLE